jgi:hypothetical protein
VIGDIKRIRTRRELQRLAKELGVREDWHEPDEQGLDAVAFGGNFDNAGHWGLEHLSRAELRSRAQLSAESDSIGCAVIDLDEANLFTEMFVVLYRENRAIAEVNLATLFAFACGYDG